ncbi:lipopolysaccharide biosynthesis protein [Variovorax guangxiensis]|uniref:O-antigen/teichoic acid export membrane protein n=1 Tax=Variovorax guangxiensis TaxID=1775474 RepID=A0A840FSW5_9BURK|nr:oligosaccharide flippase family protein [Variovorax guangxiensis]MBB4222589.1 O-antigen/teichoic acid export membrane protein [Variovorax guangxiensis]
MAASRTGLLRATFTLLAGGLLAQLLPLLFGPWLTRLYPPEQFGHYTLFLAVLANFVVLACARYDFALPLARDETEARDLMALCVRVLLWVTLISAFGALAALTMGASMFWLWLPVAVAIAGAGQWLTQWSVRAGRFTALSGSRVTQYGGAALAQVAGGLAQAGIAGLIIGPLLAGSLALAWLRKPSPHGGWSGLRTVSRSALRTIALKHRDFPLFNTPHAFAGALQDTLAVALLIAFTGEAAAGFWGLALRYLKAPATLIGGAVSQVLYPRLVHATPADARAILLQIMSILALTALPLVVLLLAFGPALFASVFGEPWREAGTLARALAPYIGLHFVAAPLGVVTLAWGAQAWALRLALVGQVMFLGALTLGLYIGGVIGGAWAVSVSMTLYFGWFFWHLPAQCPRPLPIDKEL